MNLLRNIILFLISVFLVKLFLLFCFVLTTLNLLFRLKINELSNYYFDCALTNDQSGNVYAKYQLDFLFSKKKSQFGNPDETISSRLGKLKKQGLLTKKGILLSIFLNKIDENHVEKSIEKDEF